MKIIAKPNEQSNIIKCSQCGALLKYNKKDVKVEIIKTEDCTENINMPFVSCPLCNCINALETSCPSSFGKRRMFGED